MQKRLSDTQAAFFAFVKGIWHICKNIPEYECAD
jgi:hypothetical protein